MTVIHGIPGNRAMRQAGLLFSIGVYTGVLLVLAACGHDAPRENPLDPELTPPVAVSAVLNDSSGAVSLSWTGYEGEAAFAGYRIDRKISGLETWTTLDSLSARNQLAYVDTGLAPNTAYDYRVVVVSDDGFQSPSDRQSVQGYSTGSARLLPPEPDPTTGTILLRWHAYRSPGFAEYRLVRRQVGSDQDTTLFISFDVGDTTFSDAAARHGEAYLYTVQVQVAGDLLTSAAREGVLELPPVDLAQPLFDAGTASASLVWPPYAGPRFRAYEVRRRSRQLAWQLVEEIGDVTVTSYIDSGLVGNTDYSYQIVVATDWGEEIPSDEGVGRFHPLVTTWTLDLTAGERARLYLEYPGRLSVLAAGPTGARLLIYSLAGALLEEQVLLSLPPDTGLPPASYATALLKDGRRIVSLAAADGSAVALLSYTPDGELQRIETQPFASMLPALAQEEGKVLSEIGLLAFNPEKYGEFGLSPHDVSFGNLEVNGAPLTLDPRRGTSAGWYGDSHTGTVTVAGDWLSLSHSGRRAAQTVTARPSLWAQDRDWQAPALAADVIARIGNAGIRIGTVRTGQFGEDVSYSSYSLGLVPETQELELYWRSHIPPEMAQDMGRSDFAIGSWSAPHTVFPGLPNRLSLEMVGGGLIATVGDPVLWRQESPRGAGLTDLLRVGDHLLVLAGEQPYVLDSDWQAEELATLAGQVGAMRIWTTVNDRGRERQIIGLCLPSSNRILIGAGGINATTGALRWPFYSATGVQILGGMAGSGPEDVLFPLAVDGYPDGRIFVLDAGNARVQVFDEAGGYITQWGEPGSGPGQFDFRGGATYEDFTGSLVVGDDGSVYVADVGNNRVQVFAP